MMHIDAPDYDYAVVYVNGDVFYKLDRLIEQFEFPALINNEKAADTNPYDLGYKDAVNAIMDALRASRDALAIATDD